MQRLSNAMNLVWRDGPLAFARRIRDRLAWRLWEWRLGVRTQGSVAGDALGHGRDEFGYQPIDPRSLRQALDLLAPNEEDAFLDLGCGLGRALILAADYPFRRVLGVEFSKSLFRGAQENLERMAARNPRRTGAPRLQVFHADATTWSIPDYVTVVFLFNPFQGDKLLNALERIRESLLRSPRRLRVVYSLPKFDEDLLAKQRWLRTLAELETGNREWERLTIYEAL